MRKRALSVGVLLTVLALVAGACGGGATAPASSAPASVAASASAAPSAQQTITIASNLPTSGADTSSGLPTQNGADFAVRQLNGTLKGFKIVFKPFDDAVNGVHDPQKGAQNYQTMVADATVLGVIGPFNSNVARAVIPIAARASLVTISPSNTNECLTQAFDYCKPRDGATAAELRAGSPNSYFRIAAPDTVQGPAMADFIIDTLKLTKVAVFSDNQTFGKGVADNFAKRFTSKGGTVVSRQDFDMTTTNDFRAFLTDAKNKGAQAVYAGATSATKGCIPRAQAKGILDAATVPWTGPDGIQTPDCIKDAGDQATNMYSTVAAADAAQNPDAKATIDAYKAVFPKKEDTGAYTFAGYDCAKILIDAIGRAIDAAGGKMPSRADVIKAVQATNNLKLTTGTYSFDANGDPKSATMAFYLTKGSPLDWVWFKQFSVGQ